MVNVAKFLPELSGVPDKRENGTYNQNDKFINCSGGPMDVLMEEHESKMVVH